MGPVLSVLKRRFGPRGAVVVAAALVLGVPAVVSRALCLGKACDIGRASSSSVPFCSLPLELRDSVARGFYDGRSPDLMGVTDRTLIRGGDAFGRRGPLWPSTSMPSGGQVPIVFSGEGISSSAEVPTGTRLDAIAETLAGVVDLRRAHPEVRSGREIEGIATGTVPKLVVQVVWKGVGSSDLRADPESWPFLRSLLDSGSGTLDGSVGSLPLDPAAALATVGTGGLPFQHGIVGSLIPPDPAIARRGGQGAEVVRAWSERAPVSVIATLGDDLDERLNQRPEIGVAGTDVADRGLIGGQWYPDSDRDSVGLLDEQSSPGEVARRAVSLAEDGRFGKDRVPDLLGVALSGRLDEMDEALRTLVTAANRASDDSAAFVVTASGRSEVPRGADVMQAANLRRLLDAGIDADRPLVAALVPGGVFVDQENLSRLKESDDLVLNEMLSLRDENGDRLMADAFPSIAISFRRFC